MAKSYVSLIWRLFIFLLAMYTTCQFNTNSETTTQSNYHPVDNKMSTSTGKADTTVTIRPDDGKGMTTSAGNDENMATTSQDNGNNMRTSSPANGNMATTLQRNDNNMDTSSPATDNMVTTPQGNGNNMATSSVTNDNMVTTSSGNAGNKDTGGVGSRRTTFSINVNDTTTPRGVSTDEGNNNTEAISTTGGKPPFYAAVFGTKVSMSGDDQLILDETGLTVTCSTSASDITAVTSIHLYRTMYDSTYLESIVSISKLNKASVIHWTNVTLGSRSGVSASGQIDSVHNARLTLSIAPNSTLCEDAVEYKCIMAVSTATVDLVAVSDSKLVALYPPVEPTYTHGILVSPTAPVNSGGSYIIPVRTFVQFTCTGTVGSDRTPHEWQIKEDTRGTCLMNLSDKTDQKDEYLTREGCNFRRTSVLTFRFPALRTVPIVKLWCRPYVAQTQVGECDQLSDSVLVREISIELVPNPNDTSPSAEPEKDIPYIVRNGRTTYLKQQTIRLECTWAGEEPSWYFRRGLGDGWTRLADDLSVSLNQADERNITTLEIPRCSLADRGWYLCAYSRFKEIYNANQTVFVDIVYDKCRNNGMVIPGGGCMEIVSADTCLFNNGSIATIHTPDKSQLVYLFVYPFCTEVSIGLTLTSNKMLWKDFVWTDGSSLTYTEKIDSSFCIACKEESEFPITIGLKLSQGGVEWHEGNRLSDVVCEWEEHDNITGITIPPSNSTYSGTKPLFQCTVSGHFIATVFVCDRIYDCTDHSDEYACAAECSGTSFRCEYGGCISASIVCDFYTDCPDGTDEQNCNHPPCDDGYWRCDNLECIPVYDVCDGEEECADGSDEVDSLCTGDITTVATCGAGDAHTSELCEDNSIEPTEYTFRCVEPNRMLPSSRICDGVRDCFDKSDEFECQPTYHSCGAWAVVTHGINSTTAVDYGMAQYGAVTVHCVVVDKTISTTWPFSKDQQFKDMYDLGGGYVTDALWFELRNYNSKYRPISYQAHIQQKAMLSLATTCVQYIRPCGYFAHAYNFTIEWSNGNGNIYSMHGLSTLGCTGYCLGDGCTAYFDYDVMPTDQLYYDGNIDFGWMPITNKEQLPITMVRASRVVVLGISLLRCSEDAESVDTKHREIHSQCKSGTYYSPSLQCLMDFGPTGEPVACRDLSHLENCENFPCPEDYVKCPGSFCLHTRYRCDGRNHCPHKEDEIDCDSYDCRGLYRCRAAKRCIPLSYLCDGVRHCPRGDDERQCDVTCPRECTCQGLTYVCDNGEGNLRLDAIPSDARWISMKSNLSDVGDHVPLEFPLLTTLVLRSCVLDRLKIDTQSIFRNMTALRHLDLSSNLIVILRENTFSHTNSLQSLILNNNPIISISHKAFHGLKSLKHLHISHTRVKQLYTDKSDTFSDFKGLTSMEYLDLSSNLIQTLPSGIFDDLHSLKTLLVNNNPLLHIYVGAFSGLSALTSLQLSHTNPTRLEAGMFDDLGSLLVLNLSASNIEDLGYRSFQNLQFMKTLDIQGNRIQVHESMFAGLDSLQFLHADSYTVCCIRPQTVLDENCFAPKDLISSCSNLIGSNFLRICLWIIGVSAVVGNALVIVYRVVLDKANLKKSHSVFVINLGISDLFMGVYMVIIASVDTHFSGRYLVNDQAWRSSVLCKAAGSLSVISSEMSTFALLMITIDRCVAIVLPLSLKKITWKSALVSSSLLWIVSLAVAIIPQTFFQNYFKGEFYSRSGVCLALPLTGGHVTGEEYAVAVFIGLNGLLFLVILLAQIAIHRKCKESGSNVTSQNRKQDIAVARSLIWVVATDFCCWFPVGVIGAWSQFGGTVSADVYAWVMVFVLPINSAINPFLYTYTYLKRQRGRVTGKKSKLELTMWNVSSSDDLSTSSAVKDVYFSKLFNRRTGSVTLKQHAQHNKLSPTQVYQVARRTIEALSFLHDRQVIHGNVTEECVRITVNGKVMRHAALTLDTTPISGDQDTTTDVYQYGMLMKSLLRMLDRY